MPVISAPAIMATPRGHRISASYEFSGLDPQQGAVQALGIPLNAVGIFDLHVLGVQGAAQIGPIRTVQLSYTCYPNEIAGATQPIPGQLFIIVDTQQVFAFEVNRLPDAAVGFVKSCFTAVFPVEAHSQSNFRFALALPNFGNVALGDLWINLFDYDMAPFFAGSSVS